MPSSAHFGLLSPAERLGHLFSVPLLQVMPPADLALIAEYARERVARTGEVLVREDQVPPAFHVIVEGEVLVSGANQIPRSLGPGAAVGLLSILTGERSGIRAEARRRTRLLVVEQRIFMDLLQSEFRILHHLLRALAKQVDTRGGTRKSLLRVWGAGRNAKAQRSLAWVRPMDIVDRYVALREIIPSADLEPLGAWQLARLARTISFAAGQEVIAANTPAHGVLVIIHGTLEYRGTHSSRDVLETSDTFGLIETLAEVTYRGAVVAKGEGYGIQVDRDVLIDTFEDHTELALDCLGRLASGLLRVLGGSDDVWRETSVGLP